MRLRVVHEVVPSREALAAYLAEQRLFLHVGLDVPPQLERRGVTPVALLKLALVGSFPGVGLVVNPELESFVEALAADLAEVVLLADVSFHVPPELQGRDAPLVATLKLALVGTLAGVDSVVDLQRERGAEGLAANAAQERPRHHVLFEVPPQLDGRGESLVAALVLALVGSLPGVKLAVGLQGERGAESLAAGLAVVRRVLGVGLDVPPQPELRDVALAAALELALVRTLAGVLPVVDLQVGNLAVRLVAARVLAVVPALALRRRVFLLGLGRIAARNSFVRGFGGQHRGLRNVAEFQIVDTVNTG